MRTLRRMPSLGASDFAAHVAQSCVSDTHKKISRQKDMGLKMERNRNDRNDWEMKSLGFEKNQGLPLMGKGDGQEMSYCRMIKDGLHMSQKILLVFGSINSLMNDACHRIQRGVQRFI